MNTPLVHRRCGTHVCDINHEPVKGECFKVEDITLPDGTSPKKNDPVVCPQCRVIQGGISGLCTYRDYLISIGFIEAVPVKYMVVDAKALFSTQYKVINTCEGETVVCWSTDPYFAHLVAKRLNEAEGYQYNPGFTP